MNTKSNVCKKANDFIRNGISRKEAFVKAWALVKIEKIENRLFDLNMVDRQSAAQRSEYSALINTKMLLNEKINLVPVMVINNEDWERQEAARMELVAQRQAEFQAYQMAKLAKYANYGRAV